MISDRQVFIVVDIETDGPAAGLNSMLSLAAVATTEHEEVSRFYKKLATLPGTSPDPETTAWWQEHPDAWREATTEPQAPEAVVTEFYEWIVDLEREPIFVSNPVSFDYTFVSWYLSRFAPENPFKHPKTHGIRALDLKSYVAGSLNLSFNNAKRVKWPTYLTQGMPEHSHNALDDAIGYAVVLRKLIASRETPPAL